MKTPPRSKAQENLLKLPGECLGVLGETGGIIMLTAGESGYKPVKMDDIRMKCNARNITVEQLVDEMNAEIGVSKAERQAMQFGSLWGWHIPLANPDNYDENGMIIKAKL